MATVMCGSQSRTTRVRVAGIERVRSTELVRAREMSAIASVYARPAELLDQRAFTKRDATSQRVMLGREADNVGFGFSARTRAKALARGWLGACEGAMRRNTKINAGNRARNSDATANL